MDDIKTVSEMSLENGDIGIIEGEAFCDCIYVDFEKIGLFGVCLYKNDLKLLKE